MRPSLNIWTLQESCNLSKCILPSVSVSVCYTHPINEIISLAYLKTISVTSVYRTQKTQVRSPAVRLRLARCTAWVKRWSEAMDFLQSIFKTNSRKYWACTKNFYFKSKVRQKSPEIHANTKSLLRILTSNQKWGKKIQKFTQILSLY